MNLLSVALLSFFIGSFPTAFLILKRFRNLDITKEGSGNVGTLNSFEVTNSKLIGISVLIIDLFKGILSVLVAKFFFENTYITLATALNFAVLGHCYSLWLKFKGGRGLATAAGGSLFLSPSFLVIWLIVWFIIKKMFHDIHIANAGATFGLIIISILFARQLNSLTFPSAHNEFIFVFFIFLMMTIILTKHFKPLNDALKNHKLRKN